MNHEQETIEAVIEEATASVEEAFVAAEEATEAAIEEVQAAIEDADKEVVESAEHSDIKNPVEGPITTELVQVSDEERAEMPVAFLQGLSEQHPLHGRALPYKKIGDTLEFNETRNGKEVTLRYEATQTGDQVQYVLKK